MNKYIDHNGETFDEMPQRNILTRRWAHQPLRQLYVETCESMTDRSSGNETNINNIVARFARTGYLPPATEQPQYGDVTDLQQDLTTLHNKMHDTLNEFNEFQQNWKPREPEPTPTPQTTETPVEQQ